MTSSKANRRAFARDGLRRGEAPRRKSSAHRTGQEEEWLAWLIHGFSTRIGGKTTVYQPGETGKFDLNLGFTDSDDRKIVTANRNSFVSAAAEGKDILGLVTLRQIHSSLIRRVQAKDVHGYETPRRSRVMA